MGLVCQLRLCICLCLSFFLSSIRSSSSSNSSLFLPFCSSSPSKTSTSLSEIMTSSGDATEDESSVGGIIIHNLPSLPAGVKFNPNDIEILDHLEAKVLANAHHKLHPLIDVFITTLEGEGGICYTHPEKLPGLSKDGQPGHFFHRLPKAHTAGRTRKIRRKVDSYTSWQKTGKTRPIVVNGTVKGFKKIFVLHTKNMNQIRKHEKTNWVMHQHHLGDDANEKDGEMVVSKVFYQMQARPCAPFKKRSALETIYFNDVFC